MTSQSSNKMALSATLHCLTGCAIGEITGLVIGTILGWSNLMSIALGVALALVFGYTASLLPWVKAQMPLKKAMALVLAADTLSIATTEVVDSTTAAVIPGAMGNGLVNPTFWLVLALALLLAFWAAFPVNRYLLGRGKGHALLQEQRHNH